MLAVMEEKGQGGRQCWGESILEDFMEVPTVSWKEDEEFPGQRWEGEAPRQKGRGWEGSPASPGGPSISIVVFSHIRVSLWSLTQGSPVPRVGTLSALAVLPDAAGWFTEEALGVMHPCTQAAHSALVTSGLLLMPHACLLAPGFCLGLFLAFFPAAWLCPCLFPTSSHHVTLRWVWPEEDLLAPQVFPQDRPSPWAVLEGCKVCGYDHGTAQVPAGPKPSPASHGAWDSWAIAKESCCISAGSPLSAGLCPGPQTAARGPWDTWPCLLSSASFSAPSLCIPSELLTHPFTQHLSD